GPRHRTVQGWNARQRLTRYSLSWCKLWLRGFADALLQQTAHRLAPAAQRLCASRDDFQVLPCIAGQPLSDARWLFRDRLRIHALDWRDDRHLANLDLGLVRTPGQKNEREQVALFHSPAAARMDLGVTQSALISFSCSTCCASCSSSAERCSCCSIRSS